MNVRTGIGVSCVGIAIAIAVLDSACATSARASDGVAAPADGGPEASIGCPVDLTSDPKNCGGCLHDCFGGACVSGVCQVVTVAEIEGSIGVACAEGEIVAANGIGGNGGMLYRASVGSAPVPIVVGRDGPEWPYIGTAHIYWLEDGALKRTPRDRPGAVEEVVPRVIPKSDPRSVGVTKLVEHAGNLYFVVTVTDTGVGASTLWQVPLAGGQPASIVTTDLATLPEDSLTASSSGLFAIASTGIWTTPLAGGMPTILAAPTAPKSIGVSDTDVYVTGNSVVSSSGEFVQAVLSRILRVPLDGSRPSVFYEAEPPANHLLVDARRVYFSNYFFDPVVRYQDHAGSALHVLTTLPVAARDGISSIEQSAASVCAVVNRTPTERATIFRVAKPL